MQQPCLAVDESGLDLDRIRDRVRRGEPAESAEEFLLRVRMEAAELPDVVEATKIDPRAYDSRQTRYMPAQPDLPACPADRLPPSQWERDVAIQFLETRRTLSYLAERHQFSRIRAVRVPALKDERGWWGFFFGDEPMDDDAETTVGSSEASDAMGDGGTVVSETTAEGGGSSALATEAGASLSSSLLNGFHGPHEPRVSLVLQFDNVMTVKLLAHHASWLEDRPYLSPVAAAWIFALLARLETPLTPDTGAVVRQLYRRCFVLRSSLGGQGSLGQSEEDAFEPLARLNTIIAVTGNFFRQAEGTTNTWCEAVHTGLPIQQPVATPQQHGGGLHGMRVGMNPSDWQDEEEEEEGEEEGEWGGEEDGEEEDEMEWEAGRPGGVPEEFKMELGGSEPAEAGEVEEGEVVKEEEREEGEISD